DLTETGCTMERTYIRAEWVGHDAQNATALLLEQWCAEKFGPVVQYVQGVAAVRAYTLHESTQEAFMEAKPIMWGGHPNRAFRAVLQLGVKSGLDKTPIRVVWMKTTKEAPTPPGEDSVFCHACGAVVPLP